MSEEELEFKQALMDGGKCEIDGNAWEFSDVLDELMEQDQFVTLMRNLWLSEVRPSPALADRSGKFGRGIPYRTFVATTLSLLIDDQVEDFVRRMS